MTGHFSVLLDKKYSSGKKKKGTPPKPDNEDKKSNVSATSDRSRKSVDSNRSFRISFYFAFSF